ncbi:SCF ubiquitin ligase complex subunit [Tulasnella sp. 403]|nr:SCF ubiquitin ligase complex subunit [Tulasnella sp. 403]
MTVFREPDISPNESSEDEDVEELERSGFEDDAVEVPTTIQSPARWSSQFTFLSLQDMESPTYRQPAVPPASLANHLPHEILLHIFRQLSNPRDLYAVLLVSRAWCQCSVELLWQKPQFTKLAAIFKLVQILGKRDPIFQYATFIRRLNFTLLGADLNDQYLLRAMACRRLERLTLFGCSSVSDEALEGVLECCPHLVALDITGVIEATDASIITAARVAPRLQGVNLGGCKKITDAGVMALATQCTNLRRIKLSGLEAITDVPVTALAKHCPMLLELDLQNCLLVTDKAIRELWTNSMYLRELRLANVVNLTDRAFPAAPPSHTNESALHNANLALGLPPSLRPNPNALQPLYLSRPFDHLRMLDLTGCANLTDEALEGIVVNCPKIRNLVLAKCGNLTDEAVGSICKLGRHLHYLHLGHVSNITDRAVTRLARACTRLRYIDLACCPLLTDMSVFELAVLPKLRRIGLVRVPNLTDQAIYSLGEHQTSLERIHLSYCENISIQAINYLLQRLLKLTHLSLTGIPAFRRPELQQFCRPPPKEFTPNQRAAFCVYSGHGVSDLRRYLQTLIQSLTEERMGSRGTRESDADDDDETDGPDDPDGVDGGFIDLRDENSPFTLVGLPRNGNTGGTGGDGSDGGSTVLGHWYNRTLLAGGGVSSTHFIEQLPQPSGVSSSRQETFRPVAQVNTRALPTLGLHLNGSTGSAGPSTPTNPLPFPLTARSSVSNTPPDQSLANGAGPSTATVNGTTSTTNGQSTTQTNQPHRRSSPAFLSFASALRGAWMGVSGSSTSRPADNEDTAPLLSMSSRNSSMAGPSTSRQMVQVGGPIPLAAQYVNAPGTTVRQFAHHVAPWTNGTSSPLPSPSSSAAAFALAGSGSQAASPTGVPWLRQRSAESPPRNATNGTGPPNGDRRDLRALEESLQSALGAASSSSSANLRGRERQRTVREGSNDTVMGDVVPTMRETSLAGDNPFITIADHQLEGESSSPRGVQQAWRRATSPDGGSPPGDASNGNSSRTKMRN